MRGENVRHVHKAKKDQQTLHLAEKDRQKVLEVKATDTRPKKFNRLFILLKRTAEKCET